MICESKFSESRRPVNVEERHAQARNSRNVFPSFVSFVIASIMSTMSTLSSQLLSSSLPSIQIEFKGTIFIECHRKKMALQKERRRRDREKRPVSRKTRLKWSDFHFKQWGALYIVQRVFLMSSPPNAYPRKEFLSMALIRVEEFGSIAGGDETLKRMWRFVLNHEEELGRYKLNKTFAGIQIIDFERLVRVS